MATRSASMAPSSGRPSVPSAAQACREARFIFKFTVNLGGVAEIYSMTTSDKITLGGNLPGREVVG